MTTNKIFIFGLHAVFALLNSEPKRIVRLCIQEERQDKKMAALIQLAREHHVVVDLMSRQELDRITQEANHQGVVAFCVKPSSYHENDLKMLLQQLTTPPLILVLDGIQDPHNLGACFRSAEAAGVHAIIAPKDKSVGITPIVSKVASGAAEVVPFVQVTNLVRALEELKTLGIWIYGAAGEARETLYECDLSGPAAIVMGAEGSGLRRLTREHCDFLLKIPMFGSVSSLNVSVATGIFLFETIRQRLNKNG